MRTEDTRGLVIKSEYKQIVFSEVYVPNMLDVDNEFMTPDDIETMAYKFMRDLNLKNIDVQHNNILQKACVVESFIARKNDPDFIEGSWVVGVHIEDSELWGRILKGEINGFSMESFVKKVPSELAVPIKPVVAGITTKAEDGHTHDFHVAFDTKGNFLGGYTGVSLGHTHRILRGTVTESMNGHTHRFSFVEGLYE